MHLFNLFLEHAARSPKHTAIVFQNQHISYTELQERSAKLAQHLCEVTQTGEGTVIGILLEPGIEMIVSILAVLQTDSAYLPIDVDIPKERQAFMLHEAAACALITQSRFVDQFTGSACKPVAIDKLDFSHTPATKPVSAILPAGKLACILFTSGSTGNPKGVLITHAGIIRLAKNNNFLKLQQEDKVLNVLNYAFDGTLYNFFSALLNGATLHLMTKDFMLDLKTLSSYIQKQKITILNLTTAFFNLIIDQQPFCFKGIRKLIFGGEMVSVTHTRRFMELYGPGKLIHVYGPTENAVFSSFYEVNAVSSNASTIPIGKAVSGSTCIVLDESGRAAQTGQPGELFVGGTGLALGYVNSTELWKSRILAHPSGPLYRTGDIVRLNGQGDLEFIGRNDGQVKIRGYRVEKEEVEMALMKLDAVQAIKVAAIEAAPRTLVAFIIPTPLFRFAEFITQARAKLPEYMIPSTFYRVKEFPVTPNGKVNIKAMVANKESYPVMTDQYVAADSVLQNRLLQLWKKVLEKDQLGVEDDFFKSGGNSIKAIQLISEIEKHIVPVGRLEQLYQYPTVKMFADYLKGKSATVKIKYCIPLNQFEPGNNNFFVAPSSWGEENDVNSVAANMNGIANFFKLQIPGMFEDKLEKSLPKLAENLVKKILRVPAGTCDFIIGYSWGCFLAFEMIKQLVKRGRNACLFLFDCDPNFQIDKSAIRFDRYDFFTLDTIAQYLPHIKTQEDLDRIKKFWMNNNTIHANYTLEGTIHSNIYAFEALEYEKKADMQLWESYTSGSFENFQVAGNHNNLFKESQQFITKVFSRVNNSMVTAMATDPI